MSRIYVWMRATTRITLPLLVLLCSPCLMTKAEVPRIGLYYLDDVATTIPSDRKEWGLIGDLILSDRDIVDYCWRSHSVQLTPEAAQRLPKSGWHKSSAPIAESKLVGVDGKGFVLMVDGVRCYAGAFWTHLSSLATGGPVIMVDSLTEFPATGVNPAPQGSFQIELGYPNASARLPTHADDVRDCPSLKKALVEMRKLRKDC